MPGSGDDFCCRLGAFHRRRCWALVMALIEGWELFTVVALLGSGDVFNCVNFDRRRAVGSGAGLLWKF
jgi:hypothetical protein